MPLIPGGGGVNKSHNAWTWKMNLVQNTNQEELDGSSGRWDTWKMEAVQFQKVGVQGWLGGRRCDLYVAVATKKRSGGFSKWGSVMRYLKIAN